MTGNYAEFTREMKQAGYTILIPNMLPIHFRLIGEVLAKDGYKVELLEDEGPEIAETGLRYIHNDACYPAILVAGQFIRAIESGRYDVSKLALMLSQTGGGCRASNYIFLLRKALAKAGYGHIPVISLSLSGLERHSGFQLSLSLLSRMLYAVVYGDLLMLLSNQCRPYELSPGDSQALIERWVKRLGRELRQLGAAGGARLKSNLRAITRDFAALPVRRVKKPRVGLVGEIYVKFSSLGNNDLQQFLLDAGAEVSVPGLLDFLYYSLSDHVFDCLLYGRDKLAQPLYKAALGFVRSLQAKIIEAVSRESRFAPPAPISRTLSLIDGFISPGVKMGEGWLLPAEMLELYAGGVKNIVCAQPFGCLPNHICGKGMMRPIKLAYPDVNIVAIDYDAGATRVNQVNRLRLMLSNAQE